jgi:nicotinamidase-related amidase
MDTTSPMNVLVIIDVQNCFMFHNDNTAAKGATFLNLESEEVSTAIVDELAKLVNGKSHVVFSRDFHPINHISLEGYEGRLLAPVDGIWPKHCRNKRVQCSPRITTQEPPPPNIPELSINNIFVNTTSGELVVSKDIMVNDSNRLEVIGTELSYMFLKNDTLRKPVLQLILNNRIGDNKIGLADTMVEKVDGNSSISIINTDDASRILNDITKQTPLEINGQKYISLTKGERCNKESYSAFNYHIEYTYDDPAKPIKGNINPSVANSTGLWEWILNNKDGKNEITVTVCGLVGNVCVMHSLLQGIALWNSVYSNNNPLVKIKFVYSLQGTRFAPVIPPEELKPTYFDDAVVSWFNMPFNLPTGMKPITLSDYNRTLEHENIITSFEILGYEGTPIKIGTFSYASGANASTGGMHRRSFRRSSIRRRKNKSQKSQKGRRTYKNKRRFTKRR